MAKLSEERAEKLRAELAAHDAAVAEERAAAEEERRRPIRELAESKEMRKVRDSINNLLEQPDLDNNVRAHASLIQTVMLRMFTAAGVTEPAPAEAPAA